ncbi:hypothetical protein C8R47DRAFT_190863 [Mycena vitilis]|nr:hypothetical protein C8R47DRAFT_190863 [Mycena vitilis]
MDGRPAARTHVSRDRNAHGLSSARWTLLHEAEDRQRGHSVLCAWAIQVDCSMQRHFCLRIDALWPLVGCPPGTPIAAMCTHSRRRTRERTAHRNHPISKLKMSIFASSRSPRDPRHGVVKRDAPPPPRFLPPPLARLPGGRELGRTPCTSSLQSAMPDAGCEFGRIHIPFGGLPLPHRGAQCINRAFLVPPRGFVRRVRPNGDNDMGSIGIGCLFFRASVYPRSVCWRTREIHVPLCTVPCLWFPFVSLDINCIAKHCLPTLLLSTAQHRGWMARGSSCTKFLSRSAWRWGG